MLDSVWHLRGSVSLDEAGYAAVVLDRVEQLLHKERKRVTERGSDYVIFDAPLWGDALGPNWLAMVIYDRGRFWIEQSSRHPTLRYDLRSLHGMVFCLFAAVLFFLFGLADRGLEGGILYAAGAFAWLYGMNVVLAFARVPPAIRRAVAGD